MKRRVRNPYVGRDQFYSTGTSRLSLPPGRYRLVVSKGIEYRTAGREVRIEAGKEQSVTVELNRWINLPERGWYGADGHLHIQRPSPEIDSTLSKWMQAEDIHVANLLQWGLSKRFHNAIQYAHGPKSVYREGDYLLASGQENPRTHFLGHTITLGAQRPISFPQRYVLYRLFWEEAKKQGAISGYAHGGLAAGAQNGLAIDLPGGLLDFIEVLQFNRGSYDVWYTVLNTGFRMIPIAGSDYPCGAILPGRERFYTRVEGRLTYESWLEGIRRGRTFVTNGPVLTFGAAGKEMGGEVVLKGPGPVEVKASVRFDPARDDVQKLEVIRNGQVVKSFEREGNASEILCRLVVETPEACWLAVRASGTKIGEARPFPSLAHSAPIYVSLEGAPALKDLPGAKALSRTWLTRLSALEGKLFSKVQNLGLSRWSDDVTGEYLMRNRPALLKAVRSAKRFFEERAR